MLFSIIPKELILKTNESELVVYLKNGSIYQLKGADQPDALRGPNPYGVVLDEFEKMKYAAWEVIEPILRANNGWCWFIGTPMGKNHLFTLFQRGQQESTEWKSWLLKTSTSGIIDPLQLAEARKSMSQALYNQEWECEFLEGEGSVFRGVRDVMTAQFAKPQQNHYYVIGCDIAKVTDYTVLAVYDRQTNAQVYQDRFKTLEWPFQKKRIKAVADHFNRAVVVIDATGLGDPIADDLARANVAVESFKITNQSKKELIEKLSIYIEQRRITMLPIQETSFEFDNYSYTMSKEGKIYYGALQGFHDDCFIKGTKIVTDKGHTPIEQIKVGDLVMTRKGYRPVVATRSKIKAIITNDLLGLTGTPDHPVITTAGEVPLVNIGKYDKLHVWNEKLSAIEVRTITDTCSQNGLNSETTSGDMINGKSHLLRFIGKYGLITSAKFRQGISCITKTTIRLIMKLLTSLLSRSASIINSICRLLKIESDQPRMASDKPHDWLQHSRSGVRRIQSRLINRQSQMEKNMAGRLRLNDGGSKRARVYNLQVGEVPEYFANNILVHNCVMAHALAIHGLNPVQYERTEKPKTRIQQYYAKAQQQYDIEQTGDFLEGQDAGDWGME